MLKTCGAQVIAQQCLNNAHEGIVDVYDCRGRTTPAVVTEPLDGAGGVIDCCKDKLDMAHSVVSVINHPKKPLRRP